MLIRALLFSIVIHALVLLGSTVGNIFLRVGPVASPEMRVTLINRESADEKVVVKPRSSRGMAPSRGSRLASKARLPSLSAGQAAVRNMSDLADLAADTRTIPDEPGVAADVLRQYRLDIARAARRFRHFPTQGHAQTMEGEVLILVRLDFAPGTPAVELASSSALPELDAEAVALVLMAVRSVSVPASLRGRPVTLGLSFRYSPRDE